MALYTLINKIDLNKKEIDQPNYLQLGNLPFSRVYLVTKDKQKAEESASKLKELEDIVKNIPLDFEVKQLSNKGVLKFIFSRYILPNITRIFGESLDLDDSDEKLTAYFKYVFGIQ